MNTQEATLAFARLEQLAVTVEGDPESEFLPDRQGWTEPLFDVRLDAGSGEDQPTGRVERTWRIRVTYSKTGWGEPYSLRKVIDLAEEAGLSVSIQNDAIELT